MRNFEEKKQQQNVSVPLDCYEDLAVSEEKYNQVIIFLQEITRGRYIDRQDVCLLLSMLGEESFEEKDE